MVSGPFPEVFFMIFGMKKGGNFMKNPDGIRPGTKTAISRGTCYSVGASTKSDVRTCRKSVRNPEKTVTERRRRPRRLPGVIFHDFGSHFGRPLRPGCPLDFGSRPASPSPTPWRSPCLVQTPAKTLICLNLTLLFSICL